MTSSVYLCTQSMIKKIIDPILSRHLEFEVAANNLCTPMIVVNRVIENFDP